MNGHQLSGDVIRIHILLEMLTVAPFAMDVEQWFPVSSQGPVEVPEQQFILMFQKIIGILLFPCPLFVVDIAVRLHDAQPNGVDLPVQFLCHMIPVHHMSCLSEVFPDDPAVGFIHIRCHEFHLLLLTGRYRSIVFVQVLITAAGQDVNGPAVSLIDQDTDIFTFLLPGEKGIVLIDGQDLWQPGSGNVHGMIEQGGSRCRRYVIALCDRCESLGGAHQILHDGKDHLRRDLHPFEHKRIRFIIGASTDRTYIASGMIEDLTSPVRKDGMIDLLGHIALDPDGSMAAVRADRPCVFQFYIEKELILSPDTGAGFDLFGIESKTEQTVMISAVLSYINGFTSQSVSV